MIHLKAIFLILTLAITTLNVSAQANPYIEVLPSNSGIVAVGDINDFLITVGNTGASSIAVSKLRPIVTIPSSVVFLANELQTGLPAGWTILTNTGTQLRLCNSGDVIPGTSTRSIILKVQGVTITGPQTFAGQINFGNGTTCAAGTSVSGNNTADDFATSTIEVIAGPVPLSLLRFSASLVNCQPLLNWQTENEVNSALFEIEKLNTASGSWVKVGTVAALGNSSSGKKYSYSDEQANTASTKINYRLKMIDKDGKFSYSPIITLIINCETSTANVFPNPVNEGKLYVSLTGTKNTCETILMTIAGQTILRTSVKNGTNLLDVRNLPSGLYIVHIIEAGGINKKWKIIINN